ncbi:MAG: hypothetical protein AVDCRST_MAG56-7307 [uncultured Cytophagales bacterium]|uniref:Uncharacterized protein n=1 Tax=uncultured Cytophagales bacterium TaxID=158755 RepID=A0A6J4LD37_9SPHI|nr:MAG: hypothetical protein AVDCRST_MAG56-7307 [uncultured Cytophagales bacterium]
MEELDRGGRKENARTVKIYFVYSYHLMNFRGARPVTPVKQP